MDHAHAANGGPASDGVLACPRDLKRMAKETHAGVLIDRCSVCGGVWLDAGELTKLLKLDLAEDVDIGRHTEARGRRQTVGELACPRDRTLLIQTPDPSQTHIVVDRCRTCGGVWLDAGELRDLSEHTLLEKLRGLLNRA